MSQTRIVVIPPVASMPAPFLIVEEQGRVLQRGSLSLDGPDARLDVRTVAIAPGADVMVRWLDLPVGGVAQVRAAARWALKDHLAAEADRTVVVVGSPSEGARLTAAVSAGLLEAWVDYLGAMGVQPSAILPDSLILPQPEGERLAAATFGHDVALRGAGLAVTIQADLVETLAAGRPIDTIEDAELLERLLISAALAPPINLLSGLERPRKSADGGWRLAAALAAALLLSPLVLTLASAARDQQAADQAERRTHALIAEVSPDAARAADPAAAFERLNGTAPPPGGVASASAALFSAVETVEGAELDGMSAEPDQGLRATVSYPAFEDLEAIRTALGRHGLTLSDTSTVEDGGRIVSEVIVGAAA